MNKLTLKESFFLSFPKGNDFMEEMIKLCIENNWKSGWFNFIGAFSMIELSQYSQDQKKYLKPQKYIKEMEIVSLNGNIGVKEGYPHIHAHGSFSFDNGEKIVGGHLLKATVFVAEGKVEIFNEALLRSYENDRGLHMVNKIN